MWNPRIKWWSGEYAPKPELGRVGKPGMMDMNCKPVPLVTKLPRLC